MARVKTAGAFGTGKSSIGSWSRFSRPPNPRKLSGQVAQRRPPLTYVECAAVRQTHDARSHLIGFVRRGERNLHREILKRDLRRAAQKIEDSQLRVIERVSQREPRSFSRPRPRRTESVYGPRVMSGGAARNVVGTSRRATSGDLELSDWPARLIRRKLRLDASVDPAATRSS